MSKWPNYNSAFSKYTSQCVMLYWKEMTKNNLFQLILEWRITGKFMSAFLSEQCLIVVKDLTFWKLWWSLDFSVQNLSVGTEKYVICEYTHKLTCTYSIEDRTTKYLRRMLLAATSNNNML